MEVPEGCVVRDASFEVEVLPLSLPPLRRLGMARTCPLSEFHALENFLERSDRSLESFLPGWVSGGPAAKSRGPVNDGTWNLQVIPLDPSEMADATPSFYRAEFDAVLLPFGEEEVRLEPLLASGVPLVTTSHEIAVRAGLADRTVLHAGLRKMRVVDREDFVTEQVQSEEIDFGSGGGMVLADAVAPASGTKTLVDTGTGGQALLVQSLERKRLFLGARDARDLTSEPLSRILTRAVEWCGAGGSGGDVRVAIGPTSLDLGGRVTARFRGLGEAFDAAIGAIASGRGTRRVPISVSAAAPCRVRLSKLDVALAHRTRLRRFVEGDSLRLVLDGVSPAEASIEMPRDAKVRRGSVKLRTELSPLMVLSHRGGSRRGAEAAPPGTSGSLRVVLTPHHSVAQGFKVPGPANLRRFEFRARADGPAGLALELRQGSGEPGREALARAELESGEIPGSDSWVGIDIGEPLDPRNTYWLLLRCTEGEVTLSCDRGNAPMLKYTKDGGARWAPYDFDLRHRVLADAPQDGGRELRLGNAVAWAGMRDADLVETLADALEAQVRAAPGGAKRVRVPLRFSAPRVGTVELYDLEVEYETSEEVEEGIEKVRTIAEMIDELRSQVSDLGERLGPRAEELRILPGGRGEEREEE